MKKSTLALYSLLLALFCAGDCAALDQEIVLGREDNWRDGEVSLGVPVFENLLRQRGRWGDLDLVLQEAQYAADGQTDLLLHFDSAALGDRIGPYSVSEQDLLLSGRVVARGSGSGGFNGGRRGLNLIPEPGALFYQGTWLQDFSIEFWLHPVLFADGEEVFLWQGARWNGDRVIPQELRCTVQDRTLRWSMDNMLSGALGMSRSLQLEGITPLVPGDWHHHLLRYDARIGVLEYLVDGVPEAIVHTTDTGRENGTVLLPFVGDAGPGRVRVGGRFTGFLDELRIHRAFVDAPNLSRYGDDLGVFRSQIFDLGYTGTRLRRIDAEYRTPADSAVYFYYRMTDRTDADTTTVPWQQFQRGQAIDPFPGAIEPTVSENRGRYLQVMVEMHPDGSRRVSPELSELRLVYEQDLPPAPPTVVYAEAGNEKVTLYWNSVNEDDLGGYLVYYGSRPGSYRGGDSDRGSSPIDVGRVSRIQIGGLKNNRLYYFSVVAYDRTEPPHRSLFSTEVSARPSRLLP